MSLLTIVPSFIGLGWIIAKLIMVVVMDDPYFIELTSWAESINQISSHVTVIRASTMFMGLEMASVVVDSISHLLFLVFSTSFVTAIKSYCRFSVWILSLVNLIQIVEKRRIIELIFQTLYMIYFILLHREKSSQTEAMSSNSSRSSTPQHQSGGDSASI